MREALAAAEASAQQSKSSVMNANASLPSYDVGAFAGCQWVEERRAANTRAVTCGPTTKQCVQLFSGGKMVHSFKDPVSVIPIPIGGDVIMGGEWGWGVTDAVGDVYLWSGDVLIRTRGQ